MAHPKRCKACGFECPMDEAHKYFARFKGSGRMQQHCDKEECRVEYNRMRHIKYVKEAVVPKIETIRLRFHLWCIKGGKFE